MAKLPYRTNLQLKSKTLWHRGNREPRYDKALAVALFYFAVLMPLIFIPIPWLGFVLIFTIVPYIAGYRSSKYVNKRDCIQIGIIAGAIWSSVQLLLLFTLLNYVSSLTLGTLRVGSIETLLLTMVFLFNIAFCVLGAWSGSKYSIFSTTSINHV
jgi:hypothetical protein